MQHDIKKNCNLYFYYLPNAVNCIFILFMLCLVACSNEEHFPATFDSAEDILIEYQKTNKIKINVNDKNIQKIELNIEDSVVKKWLQPQKEQVLEYTIDSKIWGIGSKKIELIVETKKGISSTQHKRMTVTSDIQPIVFNFEIKETLPHNINNFTQGLEFDGNQLYESTGQISQSKIAKINIENGQDIQSTNLESPHFGEGITILGDTIYQLTWTTNKCFLYNKHSLERLTQSFSYNGQGWGICNDGKSIVTSDGSEQLMFRDPKTFEIQRKIKVYTNQQAVTNLNELEYIEGFIFANVWMTNNIAIIEPLTGRVVGVINGTQLVASGRGQLGEAFNGIAYNKIEKTIYVTGKNWEKMFKIELKNFPPQHYVN